MNQPIRFRISAVLALLPVLAFAQSAPKSAEESAVPASAQKKVVAVVTDEKSSDEKSVKLESYEVTGSRIRTLGEEVTAIPVFSIPQVELERRGVTRLADIRWAIPQLAAANGFNDNLTNSGTSRAQTVSTSFNLRGLGGNSTLVLVDGRRVPHTGQEAPGGAGGREDFSVDGIPLSAIERIDILPQGAGAIYGAEAIAGVINIVLKKDYVGAEVSVSYDNTFKTDVAQLTASITGGVRRGKWRAFYSATVEDQNGMGQRDRWFTATADNRVYGAATAQSFYLSQVASGAGSLSSTSSPQNTGQANLPTLTTNVAGIPVGSVGTTAANAAYTLTVPIQLNPNEYQMAIDPARRRSLVFNLGYDLSPKAQFYVESRWSRFDNYYTAGVPTLSVSLPAGYTGNPFTSAVFLRKAFYDLPRAHIQSAQENMGLNAGVRGDLVGDWRYDASVSFARNIVSDVNDRSEGFNSTLVTAGINNADATLRPILAYDSSRVTDPNVAGRLDSYRPGTGFHKDTTDVMNYSVVADGTVWNYWAGAIKAAVGAESGYEKVRFFRDTAAFSFVLTKPFKRDADAAFAEVSVPLVSEKQKIPFVHRVEVGGAVRYQDYSDAGDVVIPTYRALVQPVKWLTLRATRAEGFKPVRLYDLLAPVTTGTTTLTATSNVRDTRRGGEAVLGTFTRVSGGNPTLRPEESVSKSAGVVIDVPGKWFKGLSLSVDYYQLSYTDRSSTGGTQVLIDYFPERVFRAAPTTADLAAGYAGVITGFDSSNINIAGIKTKGYDYRLSYSRGFDFGDIQFSAAVSDPDVQITKSTPAAVASSSFGHTPARGSASLFWQKGPWGAGVSFNYQQRYASSRSASAILLPTPEIHEFNPQVSYNFGKDPAFGAKAKQWWARTLADTKVSATVINVLNSGPNDFEAANFRINADPRLRRYILSVTKKL